MYSNFFFFFFPFPDTWKSIEWWSDTCKCSACRQRCNALYPTWRAWKVCIYNYLYFINDLFLNLVTILCNQPLITNTCPSQSKRFFLDTLPNPFIYFGSKMLPRHVAPVLLGFFFFFLILFLIKCIQVEMVRFGLHIVNQFTSSNMA